MRQEWVLDAPRRMPYRAVEETTKEKAGPAPEAPAGAAAEAPPPSAGSRTDRRATQRELHGTEGREELPHGNTQTLDISAVRFLSRGRLCRMPAQHARRKKCIATS